MTILNNQLPLLTQNKSHRSFYYFGYKNLGPEVLSWLEMVLFQYIMVLKGYIVADYGSASLSLVPANVVRLSPR